LCYYTLYISGYLSVVLLYPLCIWLPVCGVTIPSVYQVTRYIEDIVTPQTGNQIYRGYSNTRQITRYIEGIVTPQTGNRCYYTLYISGYLSVVLLYPLYIWLPVCCVTMPSIYLVICLWCYYTLYVSGYLPVVLPYTGNQIYRGYSNTTDR
jgi:hypothetical protein